jgi:hypothetical protein
MPINYLALGALKHYSLLEDCPHHERAGKLYAKLRNNLMKTVLAEYDRSGYFWEIYDDSTGKGMRGHPFSGSCLILLELMYKQYISSQYDFDYFLLYNKYVSSFLLLFSDESGWTTLVVNIMAELY